MVCERCGFLLAEEQRKKKTFFSHTAGILSTGVQGLSVHNLCKVSLFALHPPLPNMPHPTTCEVLVKFVKLK